MPRPDAAPSKAENDAWWAYKVTCQKQGREVDERTFRDAWRQGCAFTFGATSQLSPAIAAFIDWMNYVTSWSAPTAVQEGCEYCGAVRPALHNIDIPHGDWPAGSYMTTAQMDGADEHYAEAETPTQARS